MRKILMTLSCAVILSLCCVSATLAAGDYVFSVTVKPDTEPTDPDIEWRREYGTNLNGKHKPWECIGRKSYTKPAFCDIDDDGDYDMFIGTEKHGIYFYRNDGTPNSPSWKLVTKKYNCIKGACMSPAFCDIDDDDDYDMFIGEKDGNINFYRNDGTPSSPSWALVAQNYNSIEAMWATPRFCDIDDDNDYDMFVGEEGGGIRFYRNDGTPLSPSWLFLPDAYNFIDIEYNSAPAFCDIDDDGDYDMFIGERGGNINFYLNDGMANLPYWALIARNYEEIDVGDDSAPAFCDIDSDGDYDMFIGERDGGINFWRNMSVPNALPIIYIDCPDEISGKVKVYISSDDDSNFTSPALYVDDKFIGRKKRMPCIINWYNTRSFANGYYTLQVRAYHLELHQWITAEKPVHIENPPNCGFPPDPKPEP